MELFFLYALLGGVGVALAAGPLGSFIVWRRMAYFGDALSHSALLGVAFAIFFDINVVLGIIAFSMLFSFLLAYLHKQRAYSSDTLLGIMAHSSLAVGLVVISFMPVRIDLMSYLFGDILAIGTHDLIVIYTSSIVTLGLVIALWRNLLFATIHQDLAQVEGINVELTRLWLMLLISLFVALSIKVVGILLVTSLLVIPAATARRLTHTPEQMACIASFVGVIAVIAGLFASLEWNTPSGPSVVVATTVLFALANIISLFRKSA